MTANEEFITVGLAEFSITTIVTGVTMVKYLTDLPVSAVALARALVPLLRIPRNSLVERLPASQQSLFNELAYGCLSHLAASPRAANLFGRIGPNEEAYALNLVDLDGMVLRVHFYTREGVCAPPCKVQHPVDVAQFGTPHNHMGNVSAVVPVGGLVHHCFKEVPGNTYTAGRVAFKKSSDPTNAPKIAQTVYIPERTTGLSIESEIPCGPNAGYWMNRDMVHVVSWQEPTITVFFIDLKDSLKSTVYHQALESTVLERSRLLSEDKTADVWEEFRALTGAMFYDT